MKTSGSLKNLESKGNKENQKLFNEIDILKSRIS
jgi:hypothetical protein